MEITRDRLEREFNLDLISTAPNVVYEVTMEDGSEHEVTNPSEFPEGKISEVREPVVRATILSPSDYRSEEHTSELQSLMRISYAVFCLKKNTLSTYTI